MGQLFSLKTASNIQEKEFIIPKPYQIEKSETYERLSLQASTLAPTSGTVLVVRRVSPGRIIVRDWLFRKKNVVPHQIKPRRFQVKLSEEAKEKFALSLC